MLEKAFEVLAVFKVVDEITKPINEMEKAVAGFKKSLENVSKSLEKLENAGKKMATFGAAITAPFAGAAYAAVEFEKTVVGEFNKVADLPEKQLAGFKKFFMELSQQIPLSANEIAQLSANLAQMGVPTDQLKQFTEMVSKAAFAFDMMADEAGKAFGQIMNAYGLTTVNQLKAVGDTINYLSNSMGFNARELVDIVKRVGGAAKQFGLSAKAVAVFGGVIKETGRSPEEVGTSLTYMLTRLQVLDDSMREVLNTVGMTAEEFQELKKKSPEEAILKLLEAMKGLDEQTRAELLKKWVGQEHFGKIAVLINNLDRLKQKFAEIKAGKYVGSMDEEVKKLMQTTWAQFQVLKNQLQNLAIAIGSLLIPPLKTFVGLLTSAMKPITDFIQAHQTLAKVLIYPAVGAGLLLTALGSLAVVIGWVGKNLFDGILWLKVFYGHLQKTAFWSRVTTFAAMPLGEQLKLLNARFKALAGWGWSSLKNLYGWLKDLTAQLWRANIAVLRFMVATLRLQTIEQIKGAINTVITAIGSLGRAIWGFIATNPYLLAFAAAALLIYKFWKPIKAFFGGLFEGLKEGFAEAFAPLKPVLSPIISAVKMLFGWIGRILKPLDDAKGGFQNVALAGKALGYAISKLIGLFAKLAIPVVNIVSIFTQLGSAIIDGLVKGIKKAAAKPVEAIKEVGKGILNGFKSLLGISSPSKLFMQFGHFLNEGLGLGLLKSLGLVKNAIGRVASVLHLPEIAPKIALEGIKTLTLPAALIASLIPPANAQASLGKVLQADRTAVLPPVNVQITINNLTVGSKENAPAVAREIAQLTKAELQRLIKEIQEELERKRY